jgi:hypothetical protein
LRIFFFRNQRDDNIVSGRHRVGIHLCVTFLGVKECVALGVDISHGTVGERGALGLNGFGV